MQRDLATLNRPGKSAIAEPHLSEHPEISGDDEIDVSPGRSLEANLDVVCTQNQPPVPRAAIGFWEAAEIKTNDKALRRYLGRTYLASYPPQKHSRIEVIGPDTTLCPALSPHAHQLDNRLEILSGPRQPIEVALALGLRLNVHHAVLLELLEALR